MKILSIRFNNINSLKGVHHIDFTKAPFDTSPLFAITGPTGSGKSTILDVVSLALFNQVPRLGRISKREILNKGALLTRNQKQASASVTYHCSKGIFTSSWSISTNRNNQLRDYDMEISDGSGAVLDIKKSHVPGYNEKLIGLNYDQFIKSVLLAQGEFAQFLKAKKDERGALLEKITGTGIYRALGRKAFERFKSESIKIEQQQNEILTHQKELLDDKIVADHTAEFKTKKEKISNLENQIKQTEKDIAHKELLTKTEKNIAIAAEDQDLEKKRLNTFLDSSGGLLSGHEKVRPIADELRAWSSLQERIDDLEKQIADQTKIKAVNLNAISDFRNRAAQFIGEVSPIENVEKKIIHFSESVRTLQKKMDKKVTQHANQKTLITEQAKETAFTFDSEANNSEKLKNLQSESNRKLNGLIRLAGIEPTTNITKFREGLKIKISQSQRLEKNTIAIEQEQKNLLQYSNEAEQIALQRTALPKDIEVAEAKSNQFNAELQSLQKSLEIDRLRASLDEHRAKLRENEACPLCGSLEHPFAKHLPSNHGTQEEMSALQRAFEKWNDAYIFKKSQLEILIQRDEDLKLKIASYSSNLKTLIEKEVELSAGLPAKARSDWEKFSSTCYQQLEAIDSLEIEKKRLSKYDELIPNLEKLSAITMEGREIRLQLQKKYKGTDINADSQALLSKWTELKKEELLLNRQLDKLRGELDARQAKKQSLEKRLNNTESLSNLGTIPEAKELLLDERTFDRLQAEKLEIVTVLNQYDTTIKLLKNQLETAKLTDAKEHMEILQDTIKSKRSELKSTRDQCNALDLELTNNENKTEKIKILKNQIATEEKHIKRWKLLNELIGDAQGKKFNDFAQDLTLRHLITLSNIRLADLSDRYRLGTPNDDEDEGLIVLDDHMGSQRRSVRTLSGGETFLLSLSLALALSDLASNNVEINSLFIDEGFGTLDPETLDQTLDTLEKLQSESSKTIGIISHVDSLKERIATQIQLERNGQGYSTLKLV